MKRKTTTDRELINFCLSDGHPRLGVIVAHLPIGCLETHEIATDFEAVGCAIRQFLHDVGIVSRRGIKGIDGVIRHAHQIMWALLMIIAVAESDTKR